MPHEGLLESRTVRTSSWRDDAWEAVHRAARVSNFLCAVVLVVGCLVAVAVMVVVLFVVKSADHDVRNWLYASAAGGVLFWAMFLSALYGLASLLSVHGNALAVHLAEDED